MTDRPSDARSRAAARSRGVACIIPAKDEQDRIVDTVTAARALPGVEVVFVCDDGSSDQTGSYAHGAGAVVVTHKRNRGKAAAIESAVNGLGGLEQRDRLPEARYLLLLDADLGESAAACGPLIDAVVGDRADLAIAVPPDADGPADSGEPAGLGLLTAAAGRGIAELTGWTPRAPLSGQRCLTRRAFELASPLADGWGAEVGMSVDLLLAGLRVEELEVPVQGPAAGRDLGASLHLAAQLRDVTRALAARGLVGSRLQEFKEAGGVPGLLKRIGR